MVTGVSAKTQEMLGLGPSVRLSGVSVNVCCQPIEVRVCRPIQLTRRVSLQSGLNLSYFCSIFAERNELKLAQSSKPIVSKLELIGRYWLSKVVRATYL